MEYRKNKKIEKFQDLNVWQRGHKVVLAVYRKTSKFPAEEKFGLVSQMRRCAVSITSNIAEGFGRKSGKEKEQFYSISIGSILELQNQLLIVKDLGLIGVEDYKNISEELVVIHKMLNKIKAGAKDRKLITKLILIFLLSSIFYLPSSTQAATLQNPPNNLGLVGYWSFDEGSGIEASDLSGNGNDGTLNGDPQWVSGKKGGALEFDGTTDEVNVGNVGILDGETAGSICFWLYYNPDSVTVDAGIVTKWRAGGWLLWVDDSGISFGQTNTISFAVNASVGNNGRVEVVSNSVTSDTWEHWCVTFEGGTAIRIYENGELNNSNTTSIVSNFTSTSYDILFADSASATSIKELDGKLDDIRIYNRALSADEVATLHNAGSVKKKVADNTGLVGHWTFDDGSGTVAGDASGNGNDGTLNGDPQWTSGKKGGALEFDGTGDYVEIPDANSLDFTSTGSHTWSAWVYPRADNFGILSKGDYTNTQDGYAVYLRNNYLPATLSFCLEDHVPEGTEECVGSVPFNEWTHVSATYSNGSYTFYINGEAQSDFSFIENWTTNNSSVTKIGYVETEQIFGEAYADGKIDDVRIYSRALSASEIQSIYEENVQYHHASKANVLTDGLVGYWDFNGPNVTPTTVNDISGNGNNGTINGDAKPAEGRLGQGFEFGGGGDYIDLNTVSGDELDLTSNFSISLWFNSNTTSGILGLVKRGNRFYNNARSQFELSTSNTLFIARVGDGSASNATSFTFEANEWIHVVCVFATEVICYKNNVQSGTPGTITITPDAAEDYTYVGTAKINQYFFDGTLDDVRIYNRALTTDEIQLLYNLGR